MFKTLLTKWTTWWSKVKKRSTTKTPAEAPGAQAEDTWKPTTSECGLQFQSNLWDWIRRGGT